MSIEDINMENNDWNENKNMNTEVTESIDTVKGNLESLWARKFRLLWKDYLVTGEKNDECIRDPHTKEVRLDLKWLVLFSVTADGIIKWEENKKKVFFDSNFQPINFSDNKFIRDPSQWFIESQKIETKK